tara:strand:+ start:246 stop:437 length:192 start_codon:yes stop_codon:yes gene_type:complete
MNPFNNSLQKAMAASSTLIGSISLFGIIGYYLSNKYDTNFWFIGLLIFGSIIGLYDLYKQINK